ncbi:hypothetical protein [Methylobacterium sp. Leaf117]|uniref:hypothetical protein n=1 Tax=Methylobacterium sp. Leaf117 TaxID=1736260 RepID=UPI0006F3A8D7|nr:hypothetical protein [Methylobacterium sp. Leaf117]KQP95510.1 hypothetical protein ASF57_20895 [Methylobacterium sp. Leaf117]
MAQAATPDPAAAADPARGWGGRWAQAAARSAWPVLGAAGLYLLMHPYGGIEGDARIYVGRALADLDPDGVGRDLMFALDGQSRFSLFPIVLRALVQRLGPDAAALAVSVAGLFAWFCAAAFLAGAIAADRRRWGILIALVVLPALYGHPGPFRIGEALATPRTLAEAAVLAGLATQLSGRFWSAALLMLVACLIHPIMGLAGLGVLAIVLVAEDRRWLALLAPVLPAIVLAAYLGLPLFGRLLQPVDPAYLGILRQRCADLFPLLWPAQAWASPLVQAASILIAGTLVPRPVRRVLYAALLAGLCGVAATIVFEEFGSSLLVIQAQPWRLLWVTSVAGAAALGMCVTTLSRGGAGERITLAVLVLGWVYSDDVLIAGGAGALAVAVHAAVRHRWIAPTRALMLTSIWLVGALITCRAVLEAIAVAWLVASLPDGVHLELTLIRNFGLAAPLALAAGLVWIGIPWNRPWHWPARAILGLTLLLALLNLWDERAPAFSRVEDRAARADLIRAVGSRPGEVLWLDSGAEAWLVLGRPSWSNTLQGASIVFSRPLAMAWSERTDRLIALGLATEAQRAPFGAPIPARSADLPAGAVQTLCAAPDAPAWIVMPLADGQVPPAKARVFPVNRPPAKPMPAVGGMVWRHPVAYGLLPCRT